MTDEPRPAVPFSEWLAEHRNGLADLDIADALREVCQAVALTKKAGTVTLTLKIAAQGDMLAITDSLTAKVPEERDTRLYWLDLAGELTRNNPLQPRLPMGVDAETGEIRDR